MPNIWYIISDSTIITIAIYYLVLRTIPLVINHYDRRKLNQVSHYPGETVI